MAKRKLKAATLLAATLTLGVFSLTACQEEENSTTKTDTPTTEQTKTPSAGGETTVNPVAPAKKSVTFMIPNKDNMEELKKYDTKEVDSEGRLQMPQDPTMEGFTFRGWYLDKACTQKFEITGYEFTKSLTLYGLFVEDTVTVHIINAAGEDTIIDDSGVPNLAELEEAQQSEALKANLTFDGWYTNAACTTPYTPESEAIEIYGRYAAKVTFNNGYEELVDYASLVKPGEKASKPNIEEIAKKYTYMDKEDIFFVDSEGNDIDFGAPIAKNTEIKVLWKTPLLDFMLIPGTNNYKCTGLKWQGITDDNKTLIENVPVVSIPSRITIDGEEVKVVSSTGDTITKAKKASKFIFNEGIESIIGFNDMMGMAEIKEAVLPNTLRVIENSFGGFSMLEKVELPQSLEVVYDSFWKDYKYSQLTSQDAYPFIVIPKSVNNMAKVPVGLQFEEGSPFYNENNMVFKDDKDLGKVLISISEKAISSVNGVNEFSVPEGVNAIQVGAFDSVTTFAGSTFEYLRLPVSFTKVSYNNSSELYKGIAITGRFTNPVNVKPESNPTQDKSMSAGAYSIISSFKGIKNIIFNTKELPEGMNKYAFNDSGKVSMDSNVVVFLSEITEGDITINVHVVNKVEKVDTNKKISIPTNTTITLDRLLEELGITEEVLNYKIQVNSCTQFGVEVDFFKPMNKNQYIELDYSEKSAGFFAEEDKDGNYVITGFDPDTASMNANGGFLLNIPAKFNNKPVVGIKKEAFMNVNDLVQVTVPSSVKYIGERAFYGMESLAEINIATGGLEKIGDEAFKYVGCIKTKEGEYIVNPDLVAFDEKNPDALAEVKIVLPLGNMQSIGAEAFNSPAIRRFTQTTEEAKDFVYGSANYTAPVLTNNKFMFIGYGNSGAANAYGIIKITNVAETKNENNRKVHQADYVATAAGTTAKNIGFGRTAGFGGTADMLQFRILKGSVQLYEETVESIQFGLVSEVEKDAFTYVNPKLLEITLKGEVKESRFAIKDQVGAMNGSSPFVEFLTKEDLIREAQQYVAVTPETEAPEGEEVKPIFQEGWLTGVSNEKVLELMQASIKVSGTWIGE